VDDTALELDEIYLSGGQRGLNIRLPTDELVKLTKATVAAISR
jgi:Cys-tRNA(Pro)/Cys-tRNA(Cys) deacylase